MTGKKYLDNNPKSARIRAIRGIRVPFRFDEYYLINPNNQA
jgi:hypothetical protein